MRTTALQFVPLGQGETPGSPDLGGWRPLPRSRFVVGTIRMTLTDHSPKLMGSSTFHVLNLREAVGLVGLMVNNVAVGNALSIVVTRLRVWEDTMAT